MLAIFRSFHFYFVYLISLMGRRCFAHCLRKTLGGIQQFLKQQKV